MAVRKGIADLWNRAGISRLIRALQTPAVGWLAFCGTVLVWHVPAIYRWAVGGELRHSLMHLSFLGSAFLFWSVVLDTGRKRRLNHFACGLFVFSAALVTGLPGALICFALRPLYMLAADTSTHDGLTVLADQQLAGLIMWIPMDLILFAVAIANFAAALKTERNEASSVFAKNIGYHHADVLERPSPTVPSLRTVMPNARDFRHDETRRRAETPVRDTDGR